MSRATKMKGIAAEGMADHYGRDDGDDDYNTEEEEIIDDLIYYSNDKISMKEAVRVLNKTGWVEEEAYNMIDDILKKKEQKQSSSNDDKKLGNALQKTKSKEDSKPVTLPPQATKQQQPQQQKQLQQNQQQQQQQQQSNSIEKNKVGEYAKIERDITRFNSPYPEVVYSFDDTHKESLQNMNLVIVGHVDSGKSTLIGHLCHLKQVIDQKLAHRNEKESKNIGKESFKFAWVNDEFDAERSRGVTIDIGYKVIQTKHKIITFLDAPGHKDFVPNMIQGVTQADYALLVIEGSPQAFERGFEFGGQTKEHAFLVKQLGVQRLIILVNKMDLIKWDRSRFEQIKEELNKFLISIGYPEDNLIYLPISAYCAENIVDRTTIKEASWYKGQSLMDLLDQLPVPQRRMNTPMRLNIYNSYYQKNKGLVVQGKVEGGVLFEKSKALIMPQGLIVAVKEISRDGNRVVYSKVGENIDVVISHKEDCEIKSGDVLCCVEYPIPTAKLFEVELSAFELTYPILKGTQIIMYINTSRCPGHIRKITAIIDKATGHLLKKNPKSYGRVVLREKMSTIGVGIITKIL